MQSLAVLSAAAFPQLPEKEKLGWKRLSETGRGAQGLVLPESLSLCLAVRETMANVKVSSVRMRIFAAVLLSNSFAVALIQGLGWSGFCRWLFAEL